MELHARNYRIVGILWKPFKGLSGTSVSRGGHLIHGNLHTVTTWIRTQRSIGRYVTYARERATHTRRECVVHGYCSAILINCIPTTTARAKEGV